MGQYQIVLATPRMGGLIDLFYDRLLAALEQNKLTIADGVAIASAVHYRISANLLARVEQRPLVEPAPPGLKIKREGDNHHDGLAGG